MYGYNVTRQNVKKLQKTMYVYNVTRQNVYKLQKAMYGYNVTRQNVNKLQTNDVGIKCNSSKCLQLTNTQQMSLYNNDMY